MLSLACFGYPIGSPACVKQPAHQPVRNAYLDRLPVRTSKCCHSGRACERYVGTGLVLVIGSLCSCDDYAITHTSLPDTVIVLQHDACIG